MTGVQTCALPIYSLFSTVNAGVLSPLLSGTAAMLAGAMLGLLAMGFVCWRTYASLPSVPATPGPGVAID